MYSIKFSKTAEKEFDKLEKDIQERVVKVLERIKIRPFHYVKKKQGSPHFILRIRDYRTILKINKKKSIILVVELGHREDIYK